MAQLITPSSSESDVQDYVETFITTDEDGSMRVNEAAMLTSLVEQFRFLPASKTNGMSKEAYAQSIIANLKAGISREQWKDNPLYPTSVTTGSDAVKNKLVEIRNKLATEVAAIEAPYQEYMAGLGLRIKAMFNSMLAPGFPTGVEIFNVTRGYIATFVTDRGEESAPSPLSTLVTLDQNDSTTVTRGAVPTGRSITNWRLYRSATGTASSAFKLQGEYPVATAAVTDTLPDERLANDLCPTFGWLEPPADLKGLTGLPNGIMLGYVGRTLYACEPYHPYAWPAKYDKPLQHLITGIVAVGQSAFVGTAGRPYLVTGSDSASLSEELISSKVPCLSARSMVAIGNSVFYASPDGLALYENGKVVNITKGVIDRKAWRKYVPSTMRAAEFDGMYMAFFTRADASKGALVFDYENRTLSELDQAADAVFANEAGLYVLNGTQIYDVLPPTGAKKTGRWDSKTFRLARPQSFGWIQVDSRFDNNGTLAPVTVRVYADGVLFHAATATSREPQRLPAGRFNDWRLEVESAAVVDGIVLATTTEELKAAL